MNQENNSIRIEISMLRDTYGSSTTIFEPECASGIERRESNVETPSITSPAVRAPEKKLTLFALRLAIFEKAATGLGTLGFIWATVVLLGGFAITLDKTDFWFITIILLIEGTRIFSRSHELEWQHQSTWSIADAGINSFRALKSSSHFIVEAIKSIFRAVRLSRKQSQHSREIGECSNARNGENCNVQRHPTRVWKSTDVPILPYFNWVFLSRNISRVFYWLQLASATACVVLSLTRIIEHNFGEIEKGNTDKRNRKAALYMFYSVALAEALLFLMEKAYWEWNVMYRKLLEEVNKECEFDASGMVSIKRFFYDAYSRCVNGSIFDGLKMDMISFATELLQSQSPDEQLSGARILYQFSKNPRFSDDTLQKIGTNILVIERLVEILNWKDPQEEEIRFSAAEILSRLAGKKQNSLRVAGIPGALESISSLLQTNRNSIVVTDEVGERRIIFDQAHYGFWTFNHLGLLILKKLARDHDNCGKIGNTRGLLPKIIDFTHAEERLLKDDNVTPSQIQTVKRSLQLVKMLSCTTGITGKNLRRDISEIVFTISNIRDILRHGEKQPLLQKISIEILTSLAIEQEATERIGGTGGVLKELFKIFFNEALPIQQNHVRISAGQALAMLALESKSNCHRILKLRVLDRLVGALKIPLLRINTARILRNLCSYSGPECFNQLKEVTACAPTVLKDIMSEENKLQEVMVGLAAEGFKYMTPDESRIVFEDSGINEGKLASIIMDILRKHVNPPVTIPRIRGFAIELAIWMMRNNASNAVIFRDLGLPEQLEGVLETTAELENFNIFSGTVGLCRQTTTIHSLVETALRLLAAIEIRSGNNCPE